MKTTLTSALFFLLILSLTAQVRLDVQGDAKIKGRLEISSGVDNLFIGQNAGAVNILGASNTFIGTDAGAANTSGYRNTFLGLLAGNNNSVGANNTFLGALSGRSNISGNNNTFLGVQAGSTNSTGSDNTFLGWFAGDKNSSGNKNTLIGSGAGTGIASAQENTLLGYQSGSSNKTGDYNTSLGSRAGKSNTTGHSNVAIGKDALFNNTDRSNLVAVGDSALFNNGLDAIYALHATQNTATGSKALYSNTIGFKNTANGFNALLHNTTGAYNTATGSSALFFNTSGEYNTANGYEALRYNTTGRQNTANGYIALYHNKTGYNNTAIGTATLSSNTEGIYNTAIGDRSLNNNTTGNHNTAIGASANVLTNDLEHAAAFGASALTNANEKTVIGRNAAGVVIGGYAGWSNLSDGRFKEDVKENVPGMEFIRQLRPVTYRVNLEKLQRHITAQMPDSIAARYLPEKEAKAKTRQEVRTGFVAQEVEAVAEKIGYRFDGVNAPKNPSDNYSLIYGQFVPSLVKAVQEQQEEIEKQEAEIAGLQKANEELSARLERMEGLLGDNNTTTSNTAILSSARLDQNQPNPFNANTTIRYFIPESIARAELRIHDTGGRVLQTIVVDGRGEGETQLLAHSLSPGHYTYTLVLDGQVLATRQMVLTR